MHTSARPAARIAAMTALLAAAAILAGCGPAAPPTPSGSQAQPTPTATSTQPAPTASATPTPTSTPTPTPTPTAPPATTPAPSQPTGHVFETQNGTMRLHVPEGWTVDDQSRLTTDHSGRSVWDNSVGFLSPTGTQLVYYDGFGSNVGFLHTEFTVVEERPTQDDRFTAMSWWIPDSGRYFVYAGVTAASSEGLEPIPELFLPGIERNHRLTMLLLGDDQPTVATEAEAEELLRGADVLEALDVMATLELTGVPYLTLPPGVEP